MKTNVALIGFMGTGKTAVGKLLASQEGSLLVPVHRVAGPILVIAEPGRPVGR